MVCALDVGGAIEHGSASVTSYVNALGLSERYYAPAVHWFHSTAFCIDGLCEQWSRWRQGHPQCMGWRDQRVYIGDGIKLSKEGHQMPGVKRLRQESANVNKPEWIRGHYFSALGLLLRQGRMCSDFCVSAFDSKFETFWKKNSKVRQGRSPVFDGSIPPL